MPDTPFAQRNGWSLYAHQAFGDPFENLTDAVEQLQRKQPDTFTEHPKSKLLKRILDLILIEIPRDPNAAEFRLGNTLGPDARHWRRAKFLGRFRLFFRFSSTHKAIIYAWVNDESTLRKAGSHTDPYTIFNKRLRDGDPPNDWDDLFRSAAPASQKLRRRMKPASKR